MSELVEAYKKNDTDFALQREVMRVLRECNPTNIITRKSTQARKRYPLEHPLVAQQTTDGGFKWKPLYAGGDGSTRRARWGSRLPPLKSVVEQTDEGDDVPTKLQVHIRQQENRRGAREARQLLRRGLNFSEHRLKLCRNGMMEPYSAEHTHLWDGSRSASVLASPILRIESGSHPKAQTPVPTVSHQQLGAILPPPETVVSQPDNDLPSLADVGEVESLTSFFFTENQAPPQEPQPRRRTLSVTPTPALPPIRRDKPDASLASESPDRVFNSTTHQSEGDFHAANTAAILLQKKFKQVHGAQLLSRNYVPDVKEVHVEPFSLSSKLRSHPNFKVTLASEMDAFNQVTKTKLDRKNAEQPSKYDKKYRALDVSGDVLPFRATAVAILHHVEAVIQRDESRSSKEEAYRAHVTALSDLRAFLRTTSLHPKIEQMLRITESFFGIDRAPPGPEQFFSKVMQALDDVDLMFFDVAEACVHIGALYSVSEQEVVDYTRKRAARFIFDRPSELLAQMESIERRTAAV